MPVILSVVLKGVKSFIIPLFSKLAPKIIQCLPEGQIKKIFVDSAKGISSKFSKVIGSESAKLIGELFKSIEETVVGEIATGQFKKMSPSIFGEGDEVSNDIEGTKTELISPETLEELNTNIDLLKEKFASLSETLKGISDEIANLMPLIVNTFSISLILINSLLLLLSQVPGLIFLITASINQLSLQVLMLGQIISLFSTVIIPQLALSLISLYTVIVSTVSSAIQIVSVLFVNMINIIVMGIGILSSALISLYVVIVSTVSSAAQIISSIFTGMVDIIIAGVGEIINVFTDMISTIDDLARSCINLGISIAGALLGVVLATIGSINIIFTTIEKFGQNLVSSFKEKMDTLVSESSKVVEKIAELFNKEIKLNIKLPKIEISGAFSSNPLQVPKFRLNWYQTGGIFTGPSIIGVGENGDEAVLPLSNKRRMKPFANAVASMIGVDNSNQPTYKGVTINIDNMSVRNDTDIKKIAEELNRLTFRENRKLGLI